MNTMLELVNTVCQSIRALHRDPISFKKLIGSTRSAFKDQDLVLLIKTKKDRKLDPSEFYVMAYYDAEDDLNQEVPIEIVIHHNFSDTDLFSKTQITEFLIQIYDATVHEFRHQIQSQRRNYLTFSNHDHSPYEIYLSDTDELDAYALSIAIEMLRHMSKERAQRYMSRITVVSKMRVGANLVSPNLKAYIDHFGLNQLTKKLAKKVYKHLDSLDKQQIFL
jgi:hypothetical protein